MFGISPTKNKMAIVCQSPGSPRPYLYGSRVQNMQRHARIYTGPAGRGLIISGSYGGHRRHTTYDGRRTTPRVWHKLPTGELKNVVPNSGPNFGGAPYTRV